MVTIFVLFVVLADTTHIIYTADSLDYLYDKGIIRLFGNVEATYGELRILADSLVYYSKTNKVFAYGNPILYIGKQKINGEQMGYNLKEGKGIILNGRTHIEKGWFDGKFIRQVAPKVLNIENGKFTTCDLNPPHYYFWAKELKVYIDDMVVCRPVVLYVRNIPVFGLPFWFFPIKKGRHSGFLYPKVGRDSRFGRYVKNISYYWVTNKWSDVTFTVDYMEYKGTNFSIEGVYNLKPLLAGNIRGSFIKERKTKRERWNFDAVHTQNFGTGVSLKAKANYISDLEYKKDYEEMVLKELDKVLTSYISLSKRWKSGQAILTLEDRRNLTDTTYTRLLPRLSYTLSQHKFWTGYISYSGVLSNQSQKNAIKRTINNNVNITLPTKSFVYVSFSPRISYKLNLHDNYIAKSGIDRAIDNEINVNLPLKLFRYFDLSPNLSYKISVSDTGVGNYPLEKKLQFSIGAKTVVYGKSIIRKPEFRHIAKPSISYSYTNKRLSLNLSNDFRVNFKKKKVDIGILNLSTYWDFIEGKLSPLSTSWRMAPLPLFEIRGSLSYDATLKKFKDTKSIIDLHIKGSWFKLDLTHNYVRQRDQSIRANLHLKLTRNWYIQINRRYDLRKWKLIEENIHLKRDLHCWEFNFSSSKYGIRWRYDATLRIKAIPEIKIGKDIIRVFMGE